MTHSSVSPERWETMTPHPSDCESWALKERNEYQRRRTRGRSEIREAHALIDSVMVPIWLTLRRRPLQAFFSMALREGRQVR